MKIDHCILIIYMPLRKMLNVQVSTTNFQSLIKGKLFPIKDLYLNEVLAYHKEPSRFNLLILARVLHKEHISQLPNR
jgi:hypothetical protein